MHAVEEKPDLSPASIAYYFKTRLPTLKPPLDARYLNPIPCLREIPARQWNFIGVAFIGWTWDAFDYFSVSMTVSEIAEDLNVSVADITWGITVVLMLRSVGAVIFGLASDKWGRKWPFIANCALFIALELGTGFVQTYKQFLGCRALFGIAMGGMYGNCAATALEDCPIRAQGVISGLLQQGYAFGYLLTVIFNRALTDTTGNWRTLFWFGACPPVLIIIYRLCLPESDAYRERKRLKQESLGVSFMSQAKQAMKTHWLFIIYLVIFMTGMNYMSHGSQDLFPTRVKKQLGYSKNAATVTNCVANLGALTGGVFFGHISQYFGRRLTLMFCCVVGGALIYPWGFSKTNAGINASVFFLQAMVQGAWGVVPIYISELSPVALKAFVVGISYQLGNLASSAASTIEATAGKQFPLYDSEGNIRTGMYDYGKVMSIMMGAIFAYTFLVCLLGPERRGVETAEDMEDIRSIETKPIVHHDEERSISSSEKRSN